MDGGYNQREKRGSQCHSRLVRSYTSMPPAGRRGPAQSKYPTYYPTKATLDFFTAEGLGFPGLLTELPLPLPLRSALHGRCSGQPGQRPGQAAANQEPAANQNTALELDELLLKFRPKNALQ
jgi:hypothetical protein